MAETITDARTRKTSVAEVTTDGTMLSTAEVFVDTDAFPFSAADVICGACAKTLRTAAAFVASRARRRSATAAITLRASVHHNYIAVAAGFSSAVESSGAGEGCRVLEMRRTGASVTLLRRAVDFSIAIVPAHAFATETTVLASRYRVSPPLHRAVDAPERERVPQCLTPKRIRPGRRVDSTLPMG